MRAVGLAVGTAVAGLVLGGVVAPPAHGSGFGFELNGVYRAVSNGDWARTNDVYMNEATVVQTWTITSTCTTVHACTGQVTSDQGWTVPLEFRTNRWIIDREHPNWLPCPDGTFSRGRQRFQFQATDANGQSDKLNPNQLTGYDRTTGDSGACGRNQQTVISMPLTVTRL